MLVLGARLNKGLTRKKTTVTVLRARRPHLAAARATALPKSQEVSRLQRSIRTVPLDAMYLPSGEKHPSVISLSCPIQTKRSCVLLRYSQNTVEEPRVVVRMRPGDALFLGPRKNATLTTLSVSGSRAQRM